MNNIKDEMYDLLGFWADKGGEYTKDALIFIRGSKTPNRLSVTRPSLISKDDKGTISFTEPCDIMMIPTLITGI
jgi:hypothetical protein